MGSAADIKGDHRLTSLMEAYRDWLLEEAAREVHGGCARLFQVRAMIVKYFQDVTRGWPPRRVLLLMRARIKQLQCYGLTPLSLSAEEAEVVDAFHWPVQRFATPGRPQVPYRTPNGTRMIDADKQGLADLQMRANEFRLSRQVKATLRRRALDGVPNEFGKPYKLNEDYLFWLHVGDVTVETSVNLSLGARHQIQYWHLLYPGFVGISNRMVASHTPRLGVIHLLGVNDGITAWDCLTDPDAEEAADQLGAFVRTFVEAVPGIIERARLASLH